MNEANMKVFGYSYSRMIFDDFNCLRIIETAVEAIEIRKSVDKWPEIGRDTAIAQEHYFPLILNR